MRRLFIVIIAIVSIMCPIAISSAAPAQSGVEERIADSQPSIKVDGCVIEFRGGDNAVTKFEVFSITGQLIKSVTVKSSPLRMELPKGFYIIKCENWTRRVMLK